MDKPSEFWGSRSTIYSQKKKYHPDGRPFLNSEWLLPCYLVFDPNLFLWDPSINCNVRAGGSLTPERSFTFSVYPIPPL